MTPYNPYPKLLASAPRGPPHPPHPLRPPEPPLDNNPTLPRAPIYLVIHPRRPFHHLQLHPLQHKQLVLLLTAHTPLTLRPRILPHLPGETQLIIADATTADEVQSRRKDFLKNETMYKRLEILSLNVVTLNGEAWARHRRITTTPF
jgi:hypothetical protein